MEEKVKFDPVSKTNEEEWHHVITVEDLGGLNRKFHVVYDNEAVQMALDQSATHIVKRVQIKGFRRGKAPKQLVKKYYTKEIEQSASSLLTQEGFLHACYENKIQPLDKPNVENAIFNMDGTFECDIILEVKPKIEPSGYIGIQLDKPNVSVDEIRDGFIKNSIEQYSVETPTEEIKDQSVVIIDFKTVKEDGQEISQTNDYKFVVNEKHDPPFGNNLIGKKVGDEFVENITLPEEIKEHGGSKANVSIKIKSVFKKRKPTNEELTKSMEAPSYEELMKAFHTRAEYEAKNKELQTLEEQVVDKLIESHTFDVPEGWVDDEEKYLISQLNIGVNLEDDNVKKYIRTMAERNVRRSFILEAIYDLEPDLKITKEEFDLWLESESNRRQMSPSVFQKELEKENMIDGVIGLIKHKKVLGYIISQAKIGDMENSQEEINIPENPFE